MGPEGVKLFMKYLKSLFASCCVAALGAATIGCSDRSRDAILAVEAVELSVGTPHTATFEAFGETDEYCIELEGGVLYKVTTSNLSLNVDTLLHFLAQDGFLLVENDNANGGKASELFFWSPIDVKYLIRVTDLDTIQPDGTYDILVEFVDQTGPPGPAGPPGPDGEDGEDGEDGVDGEDGEDGEDGVDGNDGKDGLPPPLLARYRLCNHPDGGAAPPYYGLRLDELFDLTEGHDKFTFNFEAPGSFVYLDYDGVSIRIHGIAYGGKDEGGSYDSEHSGYVHIDFTYTLVTPAPGDDDLISSQGNGTLIWKAGTPDEETIPLAPFNGENSFSFRFGDEDHDYGHRGFYGLSGWGWLNHGEDLENHYYSSDWLFTVCDCNKCPYEEEPQREAPE